MREHSFYGWNKKCAVMGVAKLRRFKLVEEDNRKLKQLVADLSLDKRMLQRVYKQTQSLDRKRVLVKRLQGRYDVRNRGEGHFFNGLLAARITGSWARGDTLLRDVLKAIDGLQNVKEIDDPVRFAPGEIDVRGCDFGSGYIFE